MSEIRVHVIGAESDTISKRLERATFDADMLRGLLEQAEEQANSAVRGIESQLAAALARADRLAVANAELREALGNSTRELQGWHDERPDPPGPLHDYCVSCGYLNDARAILATAPDTRGADLLGAAKEVADVFDEYPDKADVEDVFDAIRQLSRALADGQEVIG